jgi:hypothetical protein
MLGRIALPLFCRKLLERSLRIVSLVILEMGYMR